MPKTNNQKKRILYLISLFSEQSNEDNAFTIDEIIEYLQRYSVKAERKTIYDDIKMLREFNYDIICTKSKKYRYFLGSGSFELAELKLLADAVACSNFISENKSRKLISKISSLTNVYDAKLIQREVIVTNRVKSMNEKIYYNVDKLHMAIINSKQVSFRYFDYNIKKQKIYRHNGKSYTVNPYALTWDKGNYYLMCGYLEHPGVTVFRVDKIDGIEITEKPRIMPEKPFNLAEYSKQVFSMFGGELETVRIIFDNSLLTSVYDKFGKDVNAEPFDETHFSVCTQVSVSPTFFGWLMQFGSKAEIVSPVSVRERFLTHLADIHNIYHET